MEIQIILASIFNFLVVLFLLWKFGRKPAVQMVQTRSQTLAEMIAESEKQYQEAEKLLSESEVAWKESSAHAKAQFEEAKKNIERLRNEVIRTSEAQAIRIREEAKRTAQSEVEKAGQALRKEIFEMSFQLAIRFMQKSLTEEDRSKIVAEFVHDVGATRRTLEGVR